MSTAILDHELHIPSNWRGVELARDESWVHRLDDEEVADLERGLAAAKATGKPIAGVERDDFPLGKLEGSIARWMAELERGRGFVNVRGLPVDRHSEEDAGLMLFGLGLYMGTAVSQNAAGDVLGHVRDTGADGTDPTVRLYKTRVELGFHSDGADVIALMCLRQGKSGGANKLVSTVALYEELRRRRPDLIHLLYEPFCFDNHGQESEGQPGYFKMPICRYADEKLSFFHIPWYIRNAQRHADVPRLTAEQHELLDLIDEVADDPSIHFEMKLEPGEFNLLKNNTALHARTAYEDFDEPEKKRHLLRLWLTAHGEWSDGDELLRGGIPKKEGVASDEEVIGKPDAG